MKYATLTHRGTSVPAVQVADGWRTSAAHGATMLDLVTGYGIDFSGPIVADHDAVFELPYRPPTIFGIGLNYHDTVRDMGWDIPKEPYLFPKLSSSACGPDDSIVVDTALTTRVDWEAELAVVIGSPAKNVPVENAWDVVFGFTAANDISARDLQAADGQWVRGKGLDTFCPLGPSIVTKDDIENPHDVGIKTWVNGALMQDGRTSDMIFEIPALISYCSRFFSLRPGDVILSGTPSGCGDFRTPRIALTPGDAVEIEVEHIGRQRNAVVAPSADSRRLQSVSLGETLS